MIRNLYIKNHFQKKYFKRKNVNKFSIKFKKEIFNINKEIEDPKKTINVLSKRFKFNFKFKDLKRYKKYKKIALIGMGGSILGAEAIHYFFKEKIQKKVYFFNNLDGNQITQFKNKNNTNKVLFIVISKSGNTVETLTNMFLLNIIKKFKKYNYNFRKENNSLFLYQNIIYFILNIKILVVVSQCYLR